jgi:hypothetical protein
LTENIETVKKEKRYVIKQIPRLSWSLDKPKNNGQNRGYV